MAPGPRAKIKDHREPNEMRLGWKDAEIESKRQEGDRSSLSHAIFLIAPLFVPMSWASCSEIDMPLAFLLPSATLSRPLYKTFPEMSSYTISISDFQCLFKPITHVWLSLSPPDNECKYEIFGIADWERHEACHCERLWWIKVTWFTRGTNTRANHYKCFIDFEFATVWYRANKTLLKSSESPGFWGAF